MTTLVYLHGFLSSPQSHKALLTKSFLHHHYPQVDYVCPQLSARPSEARAQLAALCERYAGQELVLIGSSLGGFWATYLIEQGAAAKAVLVNPAVRPQTRFSEFLGRPLQYYHGAQTAVLTEGDLETLLACDPPHIARPQRYWLLLQSGDETLDYRLAQQHYSACACTLEEGGSHSFDGFEHWLPRVSAFLLNRD